MVFDPLVLRLELLVVNLIILSTYRKFIGILLFEVNSVEMK